MQKTVYNHWESGGPRKRILERFGAYLEMIGNHCISCFFRRKDQVESRNEYQYTRKFAENVVKHNGNGGSGNDQKSLMRKQKSRNSQNAKTVGNTEDN